MVETESMAKALLGMLFFATVAFAQAAPEDKGAASDERSDARSEEIRREVDARLEQAKKELRDEVRAEMAAQSATKGWQEEWTEEKRKLELLTLDGYFRIRPDLFNKLDLGRQPDPGGFMLFPKVGNARTITGVNMRLRLEPTVNISEDVRVRMQLDALNNVVFGSTPDYGFTRPQSLQYAIFSQSQVPPTSPANALENSILVRRAYGEVSTPVGILRFGRMGNQWGLGMLHNDGNCLDCDFGDTVDRIQLVSEPFGGWYISPMIDFNLSGPTFNPSAGQNPSLSGPIWNTSASQGVNYPLLNSAGITSYVLAIARRDTDQQAKAKLDAGGSIFNYGIHVTYSSQKNDAADYYSAATLPSTVSPNTLLLIPRSAVIVTPDVWLKYERKSFRIELEAAGILGSIGNRALTAATANDPAQNQMLFVREFGAVLQAEYRLVDNKLHIGMEAGLASGDPAPGLGNYPNRPGSGLEGNTAPGDIDGRQYVCYASGGCPDAYISNFRFNRDYRVDMILWRELLGSVTDAVYLKPSIKYDIADGFQVFGAGIYSRMLHKASSPNGADPNLGVEFNVGAQYETQDGFRAAVAWGILLPMAGLSNVNSANSGQPALDTAQVVRGWLGMKF